MPNLNSYYAEFVPTIYDASSSMAVVDNMFNAISVKFRRRLRDSTVCEILLPLEGSRPSERTDAVSMSYRDPTNNKQLFAGLFHKETIVHDKGMGPLRKIVFVDGLGAMQWVYNLYPADTSLITSFSGSTAGSIFQHVITENCRDGLASNGREFDSSFQFVQGSGSAGSTLDYTCEYKNVYQICKEMLKIDNLVTSSLISGSFLNVNTVAYSASDSGLYLSEYAGNIIETESERLDSDHRSKVHVRGTGVSANREGSTFVQDENGREMVILASNAIDSTEVNAIGDSYLNKELDKQEDSYEYFPDDYGSVFAGFSQETDVGETVHVNGVERLLVGIVIESGLKNRIVFEVEQ